MSRHGENIRKRKDGRWEARFIEQYIGGKAKYRYVYAHSYPEVKAKRNQLLKAAVPKLTSAKSFESFENLARIWLEHMEVSIKESSYTRYIRNMQKYILPYLGKIQMQKIDISLLNQFADHLVKKGGCSGNGLSAKTASDILIVLKNCLKFGDRNGYPCPNLAMLQQAKASKKEIVIISDADKATLEQILFASNDPVGLGILLSRYTGIRIGELCALQWSDIDFQNGILKISKTVERISNNNTLSQKKTKIIISEPKTGASCRYIPIIQMLLDHLKKFAASPEIYILTGTKKPTEPHTFYVRYKRFLKRNHLGDYTFHALRHTFATDCAENGFDTKALSEILGHSSITTTLKCYVHPTMEAKRTQLERIASVGFHGQNRSQA